MPYGWKAFIWACFLVLGWNMGFSVGSNGLEGVKVEYKGVVGSGRRITIPRIYVWTYELWEGSVVDVTMYNESLKNSSFLARIQQGFRIQIPRIEYEDLELKPGSIVKVHLKKIEREKKV